MGQWWHDHGLFLTAILAAVSLLGTASLLLLLIRVPADYFIRPPSLPPLHPIWHAVRALVRNALGFALLFVGLIMALPLVPGPGLLAVVLGLSLTSFPGKRKLEIRILRLPLLSSWIDKLRRRFGRPPLMIPAARTDPFEMVDSTKNDLHPM